ncbi:Protein LIGHT-DEPENDENT SHORT HYPOCOTYLS 5 [Exaiptasia diaphana]|nr:Protein LIGHT-DEPENDENT SHORT HYPOCOTYLS 5 [Exaiptasia diaphana]
MVKPYEKQKGAWHKELVDFLVCLETPKTLNSACADDILKFLVWKDKNGHTTAHELRCPEVGNKKSSCGCPKRLAAGNVDSLIGKLGSIFNDTGLGGEWDDRLGMGNPVSHNSIKSYLKLIKEEQARARVLPSRAVPIFVEKLRLLTEYLIGEIQFRHCTPIRWGVRGMKPKLIASLKRHLESKNRTDVNMLDKSNMSFSGLRKILDAEMKSVHAKGVTNRKKEKELITDEEEEPMWRKGVLGQSTAEILLKTVYFYNGKHFGMRSQEHRQLRISDIEIEGDEHIIYRENSSKTFHGGIADLKKKARVIKHVCHEKGNENHDRCLVKIYKRYFDLVKCLCVKAQAFYFQPYKDGKFAYKNCVVGIHTLNEILPSLCLAIGCKRKTSHSLRVTCVSKLFNASVDEKLIRSRTGHVLAYEKSSKEQEQKVSNILNPPAQPKQVSFESKNEIKGIDISNDDIEMPVFDVNELESIFNDITGNEHEAQFDFTSGGPINISGNCNVTINQFKI